MIIIIIIFIPTEVQLPFSIWFSSLESQTLSAVYWGYWAKRDKLHSEMRWDEDETRPNRWIKKKHIPNLKHGLTIWSNYRNLFQGGWIMYRICNESTWYDRALSDATRDKLWKNLMLMIPIHQVNRLNFKLINLCPHILSCPRPTSASHRIHSYQSGFMYFMFISSSCGCCIGFITRKSVLITGCSVVTVQHHI